MNEIVDFYLRMCYNIYRKKTKNNFKGEKNYE